MNTKNHIKTPNQDTIRGLGKLGWTESGKVHNNIKKLTATFTNDEMKTKGKKDTVICSVCNCKIKTNNTSKIPNHAAKHKWRFRGIVSNICPGSTSKQLNPNVTNVTSVFNYGKFFSGEQYIVDCSRTVLNELLHLDGLVTLTFEKADVTTYYCNDGSVYNMTKVVLYFKEIDTPVPDIPALTTFVIPVKEF